MLSNLARPTASATLTVRIIKSFEFRNFRNVVLHDVDLTSTTVLSLKQLVLQKIQSESALKPFRSVAFDTLKLYTTAHGAKTSNLIINLDHDDWFLNDDQSLLADIGFENETEVSFFNREAYDAFKANPETRWD